MNLIINVVLVIATFVVVVMGDINLMLQQININQRFKIKNLPRDLQLEAKLPVSEVIKYHGYPVENHTVYTKQGYILQMHRIPYGKKGSSKNRSAVYLQHGFLCSSADWIITGPEKGLAYILADAGYDVWLGNVRGNTYSRKHKTLDPKKDAKEFWNFSWHEIGMDDVPTMVDYVREQTRQDKIFYIGHSQGTTVSYVMLSERTEYNKKFKAVFSLAPIAYMGRLTNPLLQTISAFETYITWITNMLGIYEFLPATGYASKALNKLCKKSILQPLCVDSLFAFAGYNGEQMNTTLLPVIMDHVPAGASIKQFLHYAQEVKSWKFRQYDYGLLSNHIRYNTWTPPEYKLKNVKAPVYLYYARNDWLANVKDVEKLAKELGNLRGMFLPTNKKFNHIDFVYGIDAPNLVYNSILEMMEKH